MNEVLHTAESKNLKDNSFQPIRVCVEGKQYEDFSFHQWREKEGYGREEYESASFPSHISGREINVSKHSFFTGVNEKDKVLREHRNCIGVVVAGFDPVLGKEISFAVHTRPDKVLGNLAERFYFKHEFQKRLKEIRERCIPSSIDAVGFAGDYLLEISWDNSEGDKVFPPMPWNIRALDYVRMRFLATLETYIGIGRGLTFVEGPAVLGYANDYYYHTPKRRLHSLRDEPETQAHGGLKDLPSWPLRSGYANKQRIWKERQEQKN